MKTDDIKRMFDLTDSAMTISDEKKQQTFEKMSLELGGQKSPIEKRRNILLNQFLYIDKSFIYIYGIFVCLEIVFMIISPNLKIGKTEIISFCMAGSGVISVTAILLLDKIFFDKMAELGASCYFCTKQSIAAYMIVVESMNLVMLSISSLYVSCLWKIAVVQIVIYIVTSFLFSNVVALGILMTKTGQKSPFLLFASGIFMSILYLILPAIPSVFLVSAIWVWEIACIVIIMILTLEMKKYFKKVEKGELLCMN